MVHGSARGVHDLRGGGEVTSMPRVPKGMRGGEPIPASALSSWAAAKIPTPQKLVGKRLPLRRYLQRLFKMPIACSADEIR